jgi:hypothetical protein
VTPGKHGCGRCAENPLQWRAAEDCRVPDIERLAFDTNVRFV